MNRVLLLPLANLVLACQAPCAPGDILVTGQQYFIQVGTPRTQLLIRRGSCSDDQLRVENGTVGPSATVPYTEVQEVEQGKSATVYIHDAPLGESQVSVLVAGVNRFFRIHRTQAFASNNIHKLTFGACGPILESDGRTFCTGRGETTGVIEFAGDKVVKRWPGVVFSSGSFIYRAEGPTVSVFTGPLEGKRLDVDGEILAVSGAPELLFVSTATALHVVDLVTGRSLARTDLPASAKPNRIVSKGAAVAIRTESYRPFVSMLLRYNYADGRIQQSAEPRELTYQSGINSEGLVWQCGDGFLHFIDALGDGSQSTFGPTPGGCQTAWNNPGLFAGYDREAALCPLGDPREGNFVGIGGFGLPEFICESTRVTRMDRLNNLTLYADFSSLAR